MNVSLETIPKALKRLDQWVLWKTVVRNGEPTKVPFRYNGDPAKSNDPETWSNYDLARQAYQAGNYDGIGFVFSRDDEFVGIDLDGCVVDGIFVPWAAEIVRYLDKLHGNQSQWNRGSVEGKKSLAVNPLALTISSNSQPA